MAFGKQLRQVIRKMAVELVGIAARRLAQAARARIDDFHIPAEQMDKAQPWGL